MKASIYEIAVWLVERGKRFHVDLQKRNLLVGHKYIIKNGEWNTKHPLHSFDSDDCHNPFKPLTTLYREYKHSRPTECSMSKSRLYFKALKERDLSDLDMLYAPIRDVAQIKLELAVLTLILDGSLKWDDETMGTWFWQSPIDKDFIILKQWISK